MRILNYVEKNSNNNSYWPIAIVAGVSFAFLFLGGVKLLNFLITFFIHNWIWVIVVVLVIVVLRKIFFGKKSYNYGGGSYAGPHG